MAADPLEGIELSNGPFLLLEFNSKYLRGRMYVVFASKNDATTLSVNCFPNSSKPLHMHKFERQLILKCTPLVFLWAQTKPPLLLLLDPNILKLCFIHGSGHPTLLFAPVSLYFPHAYIQLDGCPPPLTQP